MKNLKGNLDQLASKYNIICSQCGKLEENSINFCSNCGGLLIISYFKQEERVNIPFVPKREQSIFVTFNCFLPIKDEQDIVKYHNFYTPLIYCSRLSHECKCNIFAKLEYLNITNSIKDREAIIEVCKAKELGYKTIIAASTGNLAASLASFSSKAGIKCIIYVPWSTSSTKETQIMKYGAEVKKTKNNYDELASFVKEEALRTGSFLGGLQAFRCEGYKTVSYELFMQSLPICSKIITPMGDGTTLTGIYQGFKDLKDTGITKELPQVIGVQEEGINPIVNMFKNTSTLSSRRHRGIAKAINIRNPQDAHLAIKAIKISKGDCISVTSREIQAAYNDLAKKEGIYSEYASAATYAALKKMLPINNHSTVVLVITGSGLKN